MMISCFQIVQMSSPPTPSGPVLRSQCIEAGIVDLAQMVQGRGDFLDDL